MAQQTCVPFQTGSAFMGPGPAWVLFSDATVYVRCACGILLGNLTAHAIDERGNVSGVVKHPVWDSRTSSSARCGWEAEITLVGWVDGIMLHGEQKAAHKRLELVRAAKVLEARE